MILQYFLFLNLIGDCKLVRTLSDFSAKLKISSLSNNFMEGEVFDRWKDSAGSLRLILFLRMDKLRAANFLSCRRNNSLLRTGENRSKPLVHFSFRILAGLLVNISISLACYVLRTTVGLPLGCLARYNREPGTARPSKPEVRYCEVRWSPGGDHWDQDTPLQCVQSN